MMAKRSKLSNQRSKWLPWHSACFSRAKLLLRKKRYQEQLLAQTDGQLENLEQMTHDIEFAQIEVQVVNGLKRGNEALKKVNEVLNMEDIEQLLEETKEGIEKQNVRLYILKITTYTHFCFRNWVSY